MKRGGRINPVSAKRRKRMASYALAREAVAKRCGGRCEAALDGVCSGRLEHVHHRRRRSQGGGDELANLVGLCSRCHIQIHENPFWAMEAGYLIGNEPISSAVLDVQKVERI